MSKGCMEISLGVGCRMQCVSYCPQKTHMDNYTQRSNKFLMTLEDFRWFVSTIPREVDIVMAGMFEPFLNKDCIKMIRHAFNKGHVISLYTTGAGMTLQDVEELKTMQFNHLCLHLPDNDGLMNLRVTPEYLEVIKALLPISKNQMCIGNLHLKVKEALGIDLPDGSNGLYSRGGNIMKLAIPRRTGTIKCTSCTDSLNHNVLMPSGEVLLCCMDYSSKHILGNLNEMTYEQLFTSPEYLKIQAGLKDESIDILCRSCEVSSNV